MSIQDESFPYDNDLESTKSFVFPHHKPRRSNNLSNKNTNEEQRSGLLVKTNISSSSPFEDHSDLTQSSNEFCLSSEASGKTNASEPNDLQETESKKSLFIRNNANKSVSYQDIHSEYTKRRYKHVESKVGQYIATMKAQDEKRRNSSKFYRHSSMPETLHGRETTSTDVNNDSKKLGLLRHSTNDLDRMDNHHNELQSDQDIYNYDNLTTTSSLSNKDSGSENGIFLDKQTYEQLLNEKERNEYLETKLEEKNAENWRLRQNLDIIRIEYSLCKDKLKQQTQVQRLSGSFGSINAATVLGKTSLQSLLYPQETREKTTQTDIIQTPSPIATENKAGQDMFTTPLTPDSNTNSFHHAAVGMMAPVIHKVSKSIATIQPLSLNFSNLVDQDLSNTNINMSFLRQRSNSLAGRKKSTPLPTNVSKTNSAVSSVPSSSDSAIDIEVTESPKNQRQSRLGEFIYFEQCSQRCAVVNTVKNNLNTANNSNANNNTISDGGTNSNVGRNRRKSRNLRSRMMRFFGACTKCKDPNMSTEVYDSQHSHIPLLEKSIQNYCRNVR